MPDTNQDNVFNAESQVLKHSKDILESPIQDKRTLFEEYKKLTDNYGKLLSDAKLITNVSDRLQNRLNKAHDKLKVSSEEVKRKNKLLEETIDELTKAKVGRRATTIVFMAAILLFIATEVFIEPIVDVHFKNNIINIGLKGSIALLLKPIDYLVEGYLMRSARKKSKTLPN